MKLPTFLLAFLIGCTPSPKGASESNKEKDAIASIEKVEKSPATGAAVYCEILYYVKLKADPSAFTAGERIGAALSQKESEHSRNTFTQVLRSDTLNAALDGIKEGDQLPHTHAFTVDPWAKTDLTLFVYSLPGTTKEGLESFKSCETVPDQETVVYEDGKVQEDSKLCVYKIPDSLLLKSVNLGKAMDRCKGNLTIFVDKLDGKLQIVDATFNS